MTHEEELLFKDLCEKFPYGVKVKTPYAKEALVLGIIERKGYKRGIRYIDVITDKQTYPIRYVKPYLRSLSSMTEEEYNELKDIAEYYGFAPFEYIYDWCPNYEATDWLNTNHFDYRGLIEKGLAIAVDENNNPYKE